MSKIYIILPVHNRLETTRCFIECLISQTYHNYHLILVDDGSTDNTEEMVRRQIKSITVLNGNGNWWWAGSLQQGINWLKRASINSSDIVLMINDDVTFDKFFLEKAVSILKNKEGSILQAISFGKETGRLVDAGVKADLKNLKFKQTLVPEEINCLTTRSLFMRFSDLEKIGNFYPRLLPHYLSDFEFTIRAYRKGLNLLVHPELRTIVNENTTGFLQSGFEKLKNTSSSSFIKRYFSKKSKSNPIYFTFFVLLTCSDIWIFINIIRVWKWAGTVILKQSVLPLFSRLRFYKLAKLFDN